MLADLLVDVEVPPVLELLNSLSHFISLILQGFDLLIKFSKVLSPFSRLCLCAFVVTVQLGNSLFEHNHELVLVILDFLKCLGKLFHIRPALVSLDNSLCK